VVAVAAPFGIWGALEVGQNFPFGWGDLVAVGLILAVVVAVGVLWAWRVRGYQGSWGTWRAPLLVAAIPLLIGGTVIAGNLGVLPGYGQASCRCDPVLTLVAEEEVPDGGSVQLWLTYPHPNAPPSGYEVGELDAHGDAIAWTSSPDICACDTSTWDPSQGHGSPFWIMPIAGQCGPTWCGWGWYGHAPPEAAAVLATFNDGTTRRMEPQTDGWFVGFLTWPDRDDVGQLPSMVRITALDDGGVVVAERDLPSGF
jgi:hypothetical protein